MLKEIIYECHKEPLTNTENLVKVVNVDKKQKHPLLA